MVLKPTPGVHWITLGLDLRLDHLKLLVECAQRATSWSTCGWTLLSHNSLIYVIASCVAPYQRPLRNPFWSNLSVCVHDSQPHLGCWWCYAQTGPTGFRRTSEFGTWKFDLNTCYYIYSNALWITFTLEAKFMYTDQTAPIGALWSGFIFAI